MLYEVITQPMGGNGGYGFRSDGAKPAEPKGAGIEIQVRQPLKKEPDAVDRRQNQPVEFSYNFV